MPVIVLSQRPLLHTFLIFSPFNSRSYRSGWCSERLRLMCIRLSCVIRLPTATEAEPFDAETSGALTCHGNTQTATCLGVKGTGCWHAMERRLKH